MRWGHLQLCIPFKYGHSMTKLCGLVLSWRTGSALHLGMANVCHYKNMSFQEPIHFTDVYEIMVL